MSTTEKTRTALWIPGWYEFDQPLTIGVRDRFWFFESPPIELPAVESVDFVFFNQLVSSANCQVRSARIVRMQHTELGDLRRIDTAGLDYIFYREQGEELIVNAEETPGFVYDHDLAISDWTVRVVLAEVSEPISEVT